MAIRSEEPVMPNGGSDCCGTCWFNARNKGEAGYGHRSDPDPALCTIRADLALDQPFYIYCANHPHHNRGRLRVPIGPIYKGNSEGRRWVWVSSPDTEEVRTALLDLLAVVSDEPTPSYPFGQTLAEAAIRQLAEFRERRAVRGLERVRSFDPHRTTGHPLERPIARSIALAEATLKQIIPADSLAAFRTPTVRAVAAGIADEKAFERLPILADALEEAGCADAAVLGHCREGGDHAPACWVVEKILEQA
jgi:hypothetical protein